MEWRHLPVAGGYFDQDPVLLESFRLIRNVAAKHRKIEEDKKARNSKRRPTHM